MEFVEDSKNTLGQDCVRGTSWQNVRARERHFMASNVSFSAKLREAVAVGYLEHATHVFETWRESQVSFKNEEISTTTSHHTLATHGR